MRSILAMTAAVLMVSLAAGPGFAAKQQSAVKTFDSCVALAKARGYNDLDRRIGDTDSPAYKFVRACMQGKQS